MAGINTFQKSIVVIDVSWGSSPTGREHRRPPVPGELATLGRAFCAFLMLGRGCSMAIERAVRHYSRATDRSDLAKGSKKRRVQLYANSQKVWQRPRSR